MSASNLGLHCKTPQTGGLSIQGACKKGGEGESSNIGVQVTENVAFIIP